MIQIFTALVFCVLSLFAIVFEWFEAALFSSLLSYFLLVYRTLKTTGLNSVLFLFIILFGLYGYSVPVSVFFELDIGWHRVAKIATWQEADASLFSYLLSNQLALFAILLVFLFFVNRKTMHISKTGNATTKFTYYRFAVVAGIISSLSELLNFVRVGGWDTLLIGKAHYQGAVNDLVLNIPYEGFFYISAALFSQFFGSLDLKIRHTGYLINYLLSISFVLFIFLAIGERGSLLVAIVIFGLGFTINQRITSVKPLYAIALALLYMAFNVLTLLREKEVEYNGIKDFYVTYGKRLNKLMNPANTEFGSPALNYRIFIKRKGGDYDYKYGYTYTELFWAFVPTYVYASKPKSIIYEFRDTYFAERKEQGSTSGTGFSSLMEAYMNFGYFGPFIVYLLTIFTLVYLENKKGRDRLLVNLLYLVSFNIFLIYSRSASQYILYNVVLYGVQIIIVVVASKIIPKKILMPREP